MALDTRETVTQIAGRIGGRSTPGQATIQLMRERPEVLELMAQTAFENEEGLTGLEALARWEAMSEADREARINRTFVEVAEIALSYDESRPVDPTDPDNGGNGVPIADERAARPQPRIA